MDQTILTKYLRRSYFAADGLWFSMVEKKTSFEEALMVDEQVSAVLAKIQARKVKELLNIEDGSLRMHTTFFLTSGRALCILG